MYALGIRHLPQPLAEIAERVAPAYPSSAFVVELLESYLQETDESEAQEGTLVIYFENDVRS